MKRPLSLLLLLAAAPWRAGVGVGQHRPGLRDQVDAGLGLRGRTQRAAVVKEGALEPGAVPRLAVQRNAPARERGDCDLPCDAPCDLDLSGGRGRIGLCDACSCCDAGSCDWPSRQDRADRKDRRRDGRQVYIPPYADLGRGTREPRPGERR